MNSNLNIPGFFSEKIIVGPQGIQYPRFLAQLTLTHYILRSTSFWTTPTPPICLKMPKCAIFGTFWLFHFGNTPKVGVHREKFNIGKVAQIFFGGSYICWVKWSTFLGCRSATAVILNYGLNFWLAQDWQKCKHWFQWQSMASLLIVCHCANANATPLPLEIWIPSGT